MTRILHDLQLTADGEQFSCRALRTRLWLALDRPDRLEITAVGVGSEGPPAAGSSFEAALGGETLFRGIVERNTRSIDVLNGAPWSLVAYARYHHLRKGCGPQRWFQVTDAEAAERLASSLELLPRVERTVPVHAVLEVSGDPLPFLRQRARAIGFQLAVTGGRLHFARELPTDGDPWRVAGELDVIGLSTEERLGPRGPSRGGRIEVVFEPKLRPLDLLDTKGLDGDGGGLYRSVRVMHTLDASGRRTVVDLVEVGLDDSRWRDLDPEREVPDLAK